jgi:hypothetical protein
MDKGWRAYVTALPFQAYFYHKPDFLLAHPDQARTALPLIGLEMDRQLEVLLDAAAIKKCDTVAALVAALDRALLGRV